MAGERRFNTWRGRLTALVAAPAMLFCAASTHAAITFDSGPVRPVAMSSARRRRRKLGSVMWPILGLPLTFAIVTAFVVLAVLWMAYAAPETKGRELDTLAEEPAESVRSPE